VFKEFREFINRGNVLDLAVAVVIGAALSAIVSSLVDDIITPVIGILIGGIDFSGLAIRVGEAEVRYGNFFQSVINFFVIAWAVFVLVRGINQLQRRFRAEDKALAPAPEAPPEEIRLLEEIRDLLQAQNQAR
jgi:large conductance mechanosensitive channel